MMDAGFGNLELVRPTLQWSIEEQQGRVWRCATCSAAQDHISEVLNENFNNSKLSGDYSIENHPPDQTQAFVSY